jgi:hypothetical protein
MNKKPTATAYNGYYNGSFMLTVSFKLSGSKSNRGTAIRTPEAKAAIIPNLFLKRAAINPPNIVETKVIELSKIANYPAPCRLF